MGGRTQQNFRTVVFNSFAFDGSKAVLIAKSA